MGASQPALSLGLQKLEKTLGSKLVDRGSRHFVLTQEGFLLLKFCQRLEGQLESVVNDLNRDHVNVRKRLKIGAGLSIGFAPLMHGVLLQASAKNPIELDLALQKTPLLIADVMAGNLDAALVPDDVADPALRITQLKEDQIVFVVARSFLSPFKKTSWRGAAADTPLITFPRETPMRSVVDRLCFQNDLRFKTICSMDSMDAILGLVTQGAGGTFLLRSIVAREIEQKKLFEVRCPFKLPKSGIALATRMDEQGEAIAKLVKTLIRF
jgi:DNA-binding transcriptional LysR family regulator